MAVFSFSQGVIQKYFSGDPTPWWHYLVAWLVGSYVWAALTPAVLWFGRRLPFERRTWVRRTAQHLAIATVFSIVLLAIESVLFPLTGIFPQVMSGFLPTFVFVLITSFHSGIMAYLMIIAIQVGIRYYRGFHEREQAALRLESQLVRARLGALKAQLQPHFLFNTLNAITVLVRQQKGADAEEMLARLSDLLRHVLEDVEVQEVSLDRELEYLRLYLYIEQVRFRDRLRVEISTDPETLDSAVPQMVLQPIVENALRHGIGRRMAAGSLRIASSLDGDTVRIVVADDGPGFPPAGAPHEEGIGLANTRARLAELYGGEASLETANGPDGGAVVTLTLPYHAAPVDARPEIVESHAVDYADR